MKKQRLALLAGAVAAALAAPHALAQRSMDRSDAYYHSDRSVSLYGDPDYYHGRRAWQAHPRAHIGPDNAYHSPTDGRSGGAGIPAENGVVPSTLPLVSSGEPPYPPSRYAAGTYYDRSAGPVGSTDPMRNPERSATDGRSGGTNVPSATSGAVPSTQPPEDARAGREIGGYRDPAYRGPSPTVIR
jgi:hypothetical protein